MARQQSRAQRETVSRVMHEFKHGQLRRGRGGKVKNPKQAIAIGLREAGASKYESPAENRRALRRTKRKEHAGRTAAATKPKKPRTRRAAATKSRAARGTAARTTQRGRGRAKGAGRTRTQLYAEAKRRNIPGRSKMNKAALERALSR